MLIVTVDIVPGGFGRRRTLASMKIGNVSDLADVSSYAVEANEGVNPAAGTHPWESIGVVGPHDRRQSVWSLVALAAAWAVAEAKRKQP